MRLGPSVTFGALAVLTLAGVQQREGCVLDLETAPGSVSRRILSGDEPRIEVSGGLEATCGAKWVRADSATYYEDSGILHLFRDVRYREGTRSLQADRATYYQAGDWVRAEGRVRLRDEANGSTLTGPVLEYYPPSPRRPTERMFAPARPHLTFFPDSGGGRASSPFDVDGDRMHIYGDSAIAVAGNVLAVRADLTTHSDSMDLDTGLGRLWLLGTPRVTSSDMTLLGDSIQILLEQNRVSEIRAWPNASATGTELSLEAPRLRFFVDDGEVVRAVAFGETPDEHRVATLPEPRDTTDTGADGPPGRPLERAAPPRAVEGRRPVDESRDTTSEAGPDSSRLERGAPGVTPVPIPGPPARSASQEFVLVADSIDIDLPGGQIETVVAVGRARAVSQDSVTHTADPSLEALDPVLRAMLGRDWLEGDTITGRFEVSDSIAGESEPEAPAGRSGRSELRRLLAVGSARALYHLREDGEAATGTNYPAVNYVIGRRITLWLGGGRVDSVGVIGPATGTYLEPLPGGVDSVAIPPDTSGMPAAGDSVVAPDSSGVKPPDSSGVKPRDSVVRDASGVRRRSGLSRAFLDRRRRSD